MNSKLHTNKSIVTVGEFIDMVQHQNWKRDVSFILTESFDSKTGKWKEVEPLEAVIDVSGLEYDPDSGSLAFNTKEGNYELNGAMQNMLFQELVVAGNPDFRLTVYTT
jgi:hypothetical protein